MVRHSSASASRDARNRVSASPAVHESVSAMYALSVRANPAACSSRRARSAN